MNVHFVKLSTLLITFVCVFWVSVGYNDLRWEKVDKYGDKPRFWGKLIMFIGEYQHSVDEKGRLAVPKKFRTRLKQGAIITRGLDGCLFLFTKSEWEKLAERLIALPLAQANSRAFVRLMLAGAMDTNVDSQGRILIPEYLRAFAGIKKRTVVTGLYNRVEVWDEARWKRYKVKTESASDEIAERLSELGI